jgi:hypothetical protein
LETGTMQNEARIRNRAHAIWEKAGRPQGQHEAHWAQASQEIAAEAAADRRAEVLAEAIPNEVARARRGKKSGVESDKPEKAKRPKEAEGKPAKGSKQKPGKEPKSKKKASKQPS